MPDRKYPIQNEDSERPPSYERVVKALSNDELLDEYYLGLGEDGYKQAVLEECANRGLVGADLA